MHFFGHGLPRVKELTFRVRILERLHIEIHFKKKL